MPLTLEDARAPHSRLLEVISGSRAYGTNTPDSDHDFKGVFIQPADSFLGLSRTDQVADARNDTVFFELGRFADLLARNNPNLLEMLFTPPDCVIFRHPLMDRFTAAMVLSKRCCDAFAGYAIAQIRKARGLNKKIVNPQPPQRRPITDFCHVLENAGSVPLLPWLASRSLLQDHCGLTAVPHAPHTFALFHIPDAQLPGIAEPDSSSLRLASIPPGTAPIAWLVFGNDAWQRHCREWREYHEWTSLRNESRFAATTDHGMGYDAKNLMHTFRLLDAAEEIARHGRLSVRSPNRSWLLDVRAGKFPYDDLVALAESRIATIENLFASSSLPDHPDLDAINHTVASIRRKWYGIPAAQPCGNAFAD